MKYASKETFNWGWLTFLRFSALLSWWDAWQHTGRCSMAEIAKCSTLDQQAAARE